MGYFWGCAVLFLGWVAVGRLPATASEFVQSLAGTWRFELDRGDAGLAGQWFRRTLPGAITLPGSLPQQGVGDPVTVDTKWVGGIVDRSWFTAPEFAPYRQPGNIKLPFWLTPTTYYAGPAWYQRDLEIPPRWRQRRIVLSLERPHWETRVWIDDQCLGTNNALATPHEYDLGELAPGRHRLTIRVDNRMIVDVGENSHSISDHTQGDWNGLVGRIELRATPRVWLEDLQIYPRVADKSVLVRWRIGNATGQSGRGTLLATVASGAGAQTEVSWDAAGGRGQLELPLGPEAPLWDEFSPRLLELTARLNSAEGEERRLIRFGLREIETAGPQFLINGRKTFFRGTLDCCGYPRTGHPPTDVASWKRIIGVCQAHGLNLIRFHSWCPPEAAFEAADELGFYFQVEASSWANQSTTLGDGKPVDDWIYAETDRILKFHGNHPSFLLMPYGNEPGGHNYAAYLSRWVEHYKEQDPRRLWTSGAGWPQIEANQFHVSPEPRVQAWGAGLKSRINGRPPETRTDYSDYIAGRQVPVISHEIGQWCAYPNFAELKKYTGYLKPRNFEIFRESLAAHHLGDLASRFLYASGRLQTLCYKEDIESALRTPGMGGFELLDLHDFPGQGTALVGVLDSFWESKGYVSAGEFRRFCNVTVPLARIPRRVFTTAETLTADLEIAHFGPKPLEQAVVWWKVVDSRARAQAAGKFPARTLPVANGIAVGTVETPLREFPAPARYRLVAGITGTRFENDWDIWVYPPQVATNVPEDIFVTADLDAAALARLRAGGRVLWMLAPGRVAPDPQRGKVALGFSSIFWNTAWTARQPPHTLGLLVHPSHPLFAQFPTESHSDWQWWYVITHSGAMILDGLPAELRPTVQVIDDWVTNRKLGLVVEAAVGPGRLLVCSIDLTQDLEQDPVRRQFCASLMRYIGGKDFKPQVQITPEAARALASSRAATR